MATQMKVTVGRERLSKISGLLRRTLENNGLDTYKNVLRNVGNSYVVDQGRGLVRVYKQGSSKKKVVIQYDLTRLVFGTKVDEYGLESLGTPLSIGFSDLKAIPSIMIRCSDSIKGYNGSEGPRKRFNLIRGKLRYVTSGLDKQKNLRQRLTLGNAGLSHVKGALAFLECLSLPKGKLLDRLKSAYFPQVYSPKIF